MPDAEKLPANLITELDTNSKEIIYNPFVAWMFGQLLRAGELPLHQLLNLNYVEFVKTYLQRRLTQKVSNEVRLDTTDNLVLKYKRIIYLTAGFSIKEKSLVLGRKQMIDYMIDADQGKTIGFASVVGQLTDELKGIELLSAVFTKAEKYGDRLELKFLPMWQWQSGEYLVEMLPNKSLSPRDYEQWCRKTLVDDWNHNYLAGALEFLILIIDSAKDRPRNQAIELSKYVLHNLSSYQPDLWLAASKASPAYQYELATHLDQSSSNFRIQDNSLHRYIYFLQFAESYSVQLVGQRQQKTGLTASMRLKLLRPYYQQVSQRGYFKAFLLSLIENAKDGGEVAKAFAYLLGIEDFIDGVTWSDASEGGVKGLVEWTYASLQRIAAYSNANSIDETVHAWMLIFMEEISRLVSPQGNKRDEYDTHWVQMTRRHCERLVSGLTAAKLEWIEQTWFAWSPDKPDIIRDRVFDSMREQLTVAGGVWFRKEAGPREKELYIEAVERWARAEESERKVVALFLIYSTIPSEGPHRYLSADSRLLVIFEELRQDPDPQVQRLMRKDFVRDWYGRQKPSYQPR